MVCLDPLPTFPTLLLYPYTCSRFSFLFFLGRKHTVDWLKTSDDATLVTNVIAYSSPLPSPLVEKYERDHGKHTTHGKLKLIEEVDILQDDTAGKAATVSVLKRFSKEHYAINPHETFADSSSM